MSYSMLIASSGGKTRFDQIIRWLGDDFDGLLVFDEGHKAKNLKTQTGKAVVQLQELYPKARVLYSSATGISAVSDMGYMERLGLSYL